MFNTNLMKLFFTFLFLFYLTNFCISQNISKNYSDSVLKYSEKYLSYERKVYAYRAKDFLFGICTKTKVLSLPIYSYFMIDNNLSVVGILKNNKMKYGWLDSNGKVLIEPIFDKVNFFYNNEITSVKIDSFYKIISKSGKIINTNYDYLSGIVNNMLVFKINNKYGIIDNKMNVVIEPEYDNIYNFTEGLACAKKNGKWGFIDSTNKTIITFKYTGFFFDRYDTNDAMFDAIVLSQFHLGIAKVELNEKLIYLKKTGQESTTPF